MTREPQTPLIVWDDDPTPSPDLGFEALRGRLLKALADDLETLPFLVELSAAMEPRIRRSFLQAVQQTRSAIRFDRLAQAVLAGDLTVAQAQADIASQAFGRAWTPEIKRLLAEGFRLGAQAAMRPLVAAGGLAMRFDLVNQAAATWAGLYSAELVREVGDVTRDAIKYFVRRAIEQGVPPQRLAPALPSYVGLTSKQIDMVSAFQQRLIAQGMPPEQTGDRTEQFANALLKRRGETIARTEIMRASNEGQQALWNQAVENGMLDPDETRKRWLTAHDDRLCPECEALDGRTVPLDAEFLPGLLHPPHHPNCRCTTVLVFSRPAVQQRGWTLGDSRVLFLDVPPPDLTVPVEQYVRGAAIAPAVVAALPESVEREAVVRTLWRQAEALAKRATFFAGAANGVHHGNGHAKGYPEFREDQPRAADGKWSREGGAAAPDERHDESDEGLAARIAELATQELDATPPPDLPEVEGPNNTLKPISPEEEAFLQQIQDEAYVNEARVGLVETPTTEIYKADGVWAPDRNALHLKIADDLMNENARVELPQKPTVAMLIGLPASGKSQALRTKVPEREHFTAIDSDEVKARLPEYHGTNAAVVHEESSEVAEGIMLPKAVRERHNILIDMVGRNPEKAEKMVQQFVQLGYNVDVYHATLPPLKAAQRALQRYREMGRWVDPVYILRDVGNRPDVTYDRLKSSGLLRSWQSYDTDVALGQAAKLRDHGVRRRRRDAPVEGKGAVRPGAGPLPQGRGLHGGARHPGRADRGAVRQRVVRSALARVARGVPEFTPPSATLSVAGSSGGHVDNRRHAGDEPRGTIRDLGLCDATLRTDGPVTAKGNPEFNPDQARDDQGRWVSAWHGTAKDHLDAILRDGLKASESGHVYRISIPGSVYLVRFKDDKTAAQSVTSWAAEHARRDDHHGGDHLGPQAVLKVRIPEAEWNKHAVADRNLPWEQFSTGGPVEFLADVKPEWIEAAWVADLSTVYSPLEVPDKWRKVKAAAADGGVVVWIGLVLPADDDPPRGKGYPEFDPDQARDAGGRWTTDAAAVGRLEAERQAAVTRIAALLPRVLTHDTSKTMDVFARSVLNALPGDVMLRIGRAYEAEHGEGSFTREPGAPTEHAILDWAAAHGFQPDLDAIYDRFAFADSNIADFRAGHMAEPEVYTLWTPEDDGKLNYVRTRDLGHALVSARLADLMEERSLTLAQADITFRRSTYDQDPITHETFISEVWRAWKESSSTTIGMGAQMAAAEEIGTPHRYTAAEVEETKRLLDDRYGSHTYDVLKAYARAQWEVTQFLLDRDGGAQSDLDQGLYRAMIFPKTTIDGTKNESVSASSPAAHFDGSLSAQTTTWTKLPEFDLRRGGLASTSALRSVANKWEGVDISPDMVEPTRAVLRIIPHASAVFSLPVFGKNMYEEQEAVLLGGPWKGWDVWREAAPPTSLVPYRSRRQKSVALDIATDTPTGPVFDLIAADQGPHWLSQVPRALLERARRRKHYGPDAHPGTGTAQAVHGGGAAPSGPRIEPIGTLDDYVPFGVSVYLSTDGKVYGTESLALLDREHHAELAARMGYDSESAILASKQYVRAFLSDTEASAEFHVSPETVATVKAFLRHHRTDQDIYLDAWANGGRESASFTGMGPTLRWLDALLAKAQAKGYPEFKMKAPDLGRLSAKSPIRKGFALAQWTIPTTSGGLPFAGVLRATLDVVPAAVPGPLSLIHADGPDAVTALEVRVLDHGVLHPTPVTRAEKLAHLAALGGTEAKTLALAVRPDGVTAILLDGVADAGEAWIEGVWVKGEPEFDPNQARDAAGRWTAGGGADGIDQEMVARVRERMPQGDERLGHLTAFLLADGYPVGRTSTLTAHYEIASHFLPDDVPREDNWEPDAENRLIGEFLRRTGALRVNYTNNVGIAVVAPLSPAQGRLVMREVGRMISEGGTLGGLPPLTVDMYFPNGKAESRDFGRPTLDAVNAWIVQALKAGPKKGYPEFREDQPRADDGKWTATDIAAASAPGTGDAPEGDLVEALRLTDAEQYQQLKAEWAKINNALLQHLHDPGSREVQQEMDRLKTLVKMMYALNVDPGGLEGIGLPGGARDAVIVGAGPGGLAAAIMGGTDGLDTLVVDANVTPGGQAKYSSRIENYPGFPVGASGQALTQTMFEQAERVGADTVLGVRVTGLEVDPTTGLKTVVMSNGQRVQTRTVIIAGGVEFRRAAFPGADAAGVTYGDGAQMERDAAGGQAVVLGGSNGAAQAALGAARTASHVTIVSRSPISKGMSDYQVQALKNHPKITVIEGADVEKATTANGRVTGLTLTGGKTIPASALGVFWGSAPSTKWLPAHITGKDGKVKANSDFETEIPGVFAVGDVRHGSIGRIGAAVGEGQFAMRGVWQYFAKLEEKGKTTAKAVGDERPRVLRRLPQRTFGRLVDDLFACDRAAPWLGQTIEADLDVVTKGYPEFDPDQARADDGTWTSGGGGVATAVETTEDVRKRIKGLDALDESHADAVVEAAEMIAAEAPRAWQRLSFMVKDNFPDDAIPMHRKAYDEAFAATITVTQTIYLNPKNFDNVNMIEDLHANKFGVPSTQAEVVIHEIGHIIRDNLTPREAQVWRSIKNRGLLGDFPSRVAKMSDHEAFAEVFAGMFKYHPHEASAILKKAFEKTAEAAA